MQIRTICEQAVKQNVLNWEGCRESRLEISKALGELYIALIKYYAWQVNEEDAGET